MPNTRVASSIPSILELRSSFNNTREREEWRKSGGDGEEWRRAGGRERERE